MKYSKLIILIFSIFFFTTGTYSQTVDEIINLHIAAIGGIENINSIKTVKMTGKMNMAGFEIPFLQIVKRPNNTLTEMSIQGMEMKQGYDGTTAWAINPMMGSKEPKVMEGEDAKQIIEQSDMDGKLINYSDKGSTIELVGKENLDGTEAYNIKLTDKEGNVTFYYIDTESYLMIKETKSRRVGDNTITSNTYLGDYKTVEGHLFPHSVKVKTNAGAMANIDITIEKVEVNVPIEDDIFKMPEAEKK